MTGCVEKLDGFKVGTAVEACRFPVSVLFWLDVCQVTKFKNFSRRMW